MANTPIRKFRIDDVTWITAGEKLAVTGTPITVTVIIRPNTPRATAIAQFLTAIAHKPIALPPPDDDTPEDTE